MRLTDAVFLFLSNLTLTLTLKKAMRNIKGLATRQAKKPDGAKLSHLDIGGCARVTDKGLRALGALVGLETLDLRGLCKVSVACLLEVCQKLPELRHLNIAACTTQPDAASVAIQDTLGPQCTVQH